MLEVVFETNAAGGMSIAIGRTGRIGGAFGAVVYQRDGQKPSRAEVRRLQREVEAREWQAWAEAVPLEGRREDIVPLSLLLSVGSIDEDGIGPARRAVLKELYPDLGEELEKLLEKSRQGLAAILERAGQGEPLRVWSSCAPSGLSRWMSPWYGCRNFRPGPTAPPSGTRAGGRWSPTSLGAWRCPVRNCPQSRSA